MSYKKPQSNGIGGKKLTLSTVNSGMDGGTDYYEPVSASTSSTAWRAGIVVLLLILIGLVIAAIVVNAVDDNNDDDFEDGNTCCMGSNCGSGPLGSVYSCHVDIIVVGCGSSGSMLSNILSGPIPDDESRRRKRKKRDDDDDDDRYTVLCLDEGIFYNYDDDVNYILKQPGDEFLLFSSSYSRKYSKDFPAQREKVIPSYAPTIQYGRMMGGGSGNHDYCIDVHPSQNLTDGYWAVAGGSQWNYANVVATINNYENYLGIAGPSPCTRGPSIYAVPTQSGGGELGITTLITDPDNTSIATQLAMEMIALSPGDSGGITPFTPWYNCEPNTVFSNSVDLFGYFNASDSDSIWRSSPGLSFTSNYTISPLYGGSVAVGVGPRYGKLKMVGKALVDKLLIDSRNNVHGVRVTIDGKWTMDIEAKRQVVLSANAIMTPTILERSGIGNPTVLSAAGIRTFVSAPEVGENLQQHYGTTVAFSTNAPMNFSSAFLTDLQGYMAVGAAYRGQRRVQIYVGSNNFNSPYLESGLLLGFPAPAGETALYLTISLISPESKGSVHVWDSSPSHEPNVTSNFYSDADDIDYQIVSNCTRIIYDAFQAVASTNYIYNFTWLYPAITAFVNDTLLRESILAVPFDQAHYSSTVSMGPLLDGNLQFTAGGITGLTVADTSSMPKINDGNTRTQAMVAAYKAAHYLLNNLPWPWH